MSSFTVTESEIKTAMSEAPKEAVKDTTFFMMRKIPDIESHLKEPKAEKFIDIHNTKAKDEEAQQLLEALKEKKLKEKVPSSNLVQVGQTYTFLFSNFAVRVYKAYSISSQR